MTTPLGPFPAGTLFFDVEGVPVSKTPGWVVSAWDPDPRPFPILSMMRNGEWISEARFRQLVARCDPAFAAFLARAGLGRSSRYSAAGVPPS